MNRLGLIIGVVFGYAISAQGQTVSNIVFDGIGDSSVRVLFDVSATFNDVQLRYGPSSCAGGSGGTVQTSGTVPFSFTLYSMTVNLSGLAPSTTYHVCPEVLTVVGAWTSGVDATFTTMPRTQVLPIPPTPVPTNFPAQTGAIRGVLPNCSNLQSQIDAAVPGDTIVVPAGTICSGAYTTPRAPEAKVFSPANVVTSTSSITITAHGFSENQEVRLSTDGCLPGMIINGAGQGCEVGGNGWIKGKKYWVHRLDANHVQLINQSGGITVVPGWLTFTADATADTISILPRVETYSVAFGGFATAGSGTSITSNTPIQFVSTGTLPGGLSADTTYYWLTACAATTSARCVSQLSLTPGGSRVNITSTGSGTHTIVDPGSGNMYIAPVPTFAGPWVLITTSGNLPPAGIRIDPTWTAQTFQLKNNTPNDATPRFQPGILAHNWRIAGTNFNTGTNTDYLTSTDPRPYCAGPSMGMDNSYIIFDRVLLTGAGYPNRLGCKNNAANMIVNGANIGFVNSYFSGLDYWHAWVSSLTGAAGQGIVPSVVSSIQVTASVGVGHGGVFTTTLTAPTTINFTGGSATGTAYVYFAMDGTLKVLAPNGTTGNCATTGTTCTFSTSGSPGFPATGGGSGDRMACLRLFTIALSAGAVTSAAQADATTAPGPPQVIEGANTIIAGNGPGPYIFSNNYSSGTGLNLHFDDSGGAFGVRGDYSITRNYFNVPQSQLASGPSSDGLWYGNRQPIEWKGGQRANLDGNIFDGCFSQSNPIGVCIAITPRSQGYVTDLSVTNNSFLNSSGGLNNIDPISSFAPVSKPGQRQLVSNNLFLLNGWSQTVAGNNPRGWMMYGGYAMEDLTINHNTVYDNRGGSTVLLQWQLNPLGGAVIKDNVLFYTGNSPMLVSENISNCVGLNNKAMMDCAFTSGPGTPSYTFSRNLLVPSWSNTFVPNGFVGAATVQNAFPAPLVNHIPAGTSVAANLGLIKFVSAPPSSSMPLDLRLAAASPYLSNATDGYQVGVNMDRMFQAQGIIQQLRAIVVGTTTATISAFVPDIGAPCYVGYGISSNPGAWTWTSADTLLTRQRNIPITGLASGTEYFYNMGCAGTAFPPTAVLRSK